MADRSGRLASILQSGSQRSGARGIQFFPVPRGRTSLSPVWIGVRWYLVRALRLSEGDPRILFSSTVGNVLWVLLLLSLLYPALRSLLRKRKASP